MGRVPVAQRALALSWLRPSAAGLLALTDDPPHRVPVLDCPGTVCHLLRYVRPTPDPTRFQFTPDVLALPGVCAAAAEFLESPGGWPSDWSRDPTVQTALQFARRSARVASALAVETGQCSPDAAWAAALLAPLGWFAASQADITWPVVPPFGPTGPHPLEAAPQPVPEPIPADLAATLTRRLAFRWRLPTPFAVTIGLPAIDPDEAARLGGHAGLHRVVREASSAVARNYPGFRLVADLESATGDLAAAADGLTAEVVLPVEIGRDPDPGPRVLAKLLRATATARQRSGAAVVGELESQIDGLTRLLSDARAGFETAVRDAKLSALAEFAAGASHEINNPLAVIAGNAQLLLAGEVDPDRQRRLGAVLRAVARIHDILVATHQFARPPAAHPEPVRVSEVVEAVFSAQRTAAEDRGVCLEATTDEGLAVRADQTQFRQIVSHLVRNGIEAADEGGWVRIRSTTAGETVSLIVEDGGPGPSPEAVSHLFDPFFSGRDAGRGRGLGLPMAWQLARQNGGAVRYDPPQPGGPTRFVVTLPAAVVTDPLPEHAEERRSA